MYISGLPFRHFPVSRHVRKTAETQIVRPRQTNFSGSPGSPTAMRDVSAVSVRGLMGSLMKLSDIIGILP